MPSLFVSLRSSRGQPQSPSSSSLLKKTTKKKKRPSRQRIAAAWQRTFSLRRKKVAQEKTLIQQREGRPSPQFRDSTAAFTIDDSTSFDETLLGEELEEPIAEPEPFKDQRDKSVLVLDAVKDHASPDSEFQVLRDIDAALREDGDYLTCSIISEGKTNYSYKVFLQNNPSVCLYAKLAFPYALWNPDRDCHYDVKRTENEFALIQKLDNLMGNEAPLATPYFICDAPGGAKVFATEWATHANEPLSGQFRDGVVDRRCLHTVGRALAVLNLQTVAADFNQNVKPALLSLKEPLMQCFAKEMTNNPQDAASRLFQDYGLEYFGQLLDRHDAETRDNTECLLHNDAHTFNILVEPRPDPERPDTFGKHGDVILCDWEMSLPGPLGRDVGKFQGWPVIYAMFLAVQGKVNEAYNVLDSTCEVWDTYAQVLRDQGGKDDVTMTRALRQCLGGAGFMIFICNFLLRLNDDQYPKPDLQTSEEDLQRARAAFGVIGFELLRISYMEDAVPDDLDERGLLSHYKRLVAHHIEELSGRSRLSSRQRR